MTPNTVRILLVDDEPSRARFVEFLEFLGCEILATMDRQVAMELAASGRADLVLMDIKVPSLDNYEICRQIREFSAVPIIILGTLSRDLDKVKNPSVNIRGFRALNLWFFIRKSLVERWRGHRDLAFHPPSEPRGLSRLFP